MKKLGGVYGGRPIETLDETLDETLKKLA